MRAPKVAPQQTPAEIADILIENFQDHLGRPIGGDVPVYRMEGFSEVAAKTMITAELKLDPKGNEYVAIKPVYSNQPEASMVEAYNLSESISDKDKAIGINANCIEIPKDPGVLQRDPFLITPELNGESIIITEGKTPSTYSVYYDTRENSSILYKNVVHSFDAINYKYSYNKTLNRFEENAKQTVRFFARFDVATRKWCSYVCHDVDAQNKPYIYKYKKQAKIFGEQKREGLSEKITKFQQQKVTDLQGLVATSNARPTSTKIAPPLSWTHATVIDIAQQYYDVEVVRINKDFINSQASTSNNTDVLALEAKYEANAKLFHETVKTAITLDLFEQKQRNPNLVLVKTADNINIIALEKVLSNGDNPRAAEVYRDLIDYYKSVGDIDFFKGMNQQITLNQTDFIELGKEFIAKGLSSFQKGEIAKKMYLRLEADRVKDITDFKGWLKTNVDTDANSNAFSNTIDFNQTDFLYHTQLDNGFSRKGVCHALSFLRAASNSKNVSDKFKAFLLDFKSLEGSEADFVSRFVKKIQDAQHRAPILLDTHKMSLTNIQISFQKGTLKSVILEGENHAISIYKINKDTYEFFDPNKGFSETTNTTKLFELVDLALDPQSGKVPLYSVTEFDSKLNLKNHAKINRVLVCEVSLNSFFNKIQNNKPIAPLQLQDAASLIIRRCSSTLPQTPSYAQQVWNFLTALKDNLARPILGSASEKNGICSISVVTNTGEISQKTITKTQYNAIKSFNDQVQELHTAGVRWDNKLGKFVGIKGLNNFNNVAGKLSAFKTLIQFINNRITGDALFDTQNAELANLINAQVCLDLALGGTEITSELILPLISSMKITSSGLKALAGYNLLAKTSLALGGLGVILSVASFGLSIKMLSEIDPTANPQAFKVALVNTAFAGVGAVLSTFSFALMCLGYLTLAAILGAVGVVVAVVGLISIWVLASSTGRIEDIQQVLSFFRSVEVYKTEGLFSIKNNLFIPTGAPIININYINGDVILGEYLTHQINLDHTLLNDELRSMIIADPTKIDVDLLQRMGIEKNQRFENLKTQKIVVLPATPELSFNYSYVRGASTENLSEDDIKWLSELIIDKGFSAHHISGDTKEHTDTISQLQIELKTTTINATLCLNNKIVVIPALNNDADQGIVTYEKIATILTPNEEHKELYFYMGEHSNLKIEETSQKIKYTFDVSSSDVTKTTKKHTMSKVSEGVYMFNETTKLTLNPSSLQGDSFIVKDNYEEYIYNIRTDQKTTLVMDALNLTPAEALAQASKLTLNAPQILVKRMLYGTNDIRHGLYVESLNKISTETNPDYLTLLSIRHNVAGGYYSEESALTYFYSYKESLIWAIDQKGNPQHIFSLSSMGISDNVDAYFYAPAQNDYKLISVSPFNNGVIAKYTKENDDAYKEINILCNANGMFLIQNLVVNKSSQSIPDNMNEFFAEIAKRRSSVLPSDVADKDAKIREITDAYAFNINQSVTYEESTKTMATKRPIRGLSTAKIGFHNLFEDTTITITNSVATIAKQEKPHLGEYTVVETLPSDTEGADPFELSFSIVDTKDNLDIFKPLCEETKGISLLGKYKELYYIYTSENKGAIYVQTGSGSGKTEHDSIEALLTNFADTYKDVRLINDNLILTTTDNSLVSYNIEGKKYTLLISNNTTFTKDKVPTRKALKAAYPTYELADLVLLKNVSMPTLGEHVYSYLSTHVILPINHEILHSKVDENNKDIHHIWYVAKNSTGHLLSKISANLKVLTYNEIAVYASATPLGYIDNNYNKLGFKIGDNVYKFSDHPKGIELINSLKDESFDAHVYKPTIIAGYQNKADAPTELSGFVVNGTRVSLSDENKQKNLSLIGNFNEEVFFLNKTDQRIMVAKSSSNYATINYKYSSDVINLFEEIYIDKTTMVYSVKNLKALPSRLSFDVPLGENISNAYLTNALRPLDVKFSQNYMNQVKDFSINIKGLKRLHIAFEYAENILLSIQNNTITLHDSLSNFQLVLKDILLSGNTLALRDIFIKHFDEAPVNLEVIVKRIRERNATAPANEIIIGTLVEQA